MSDISIRDRIQYRKENSVDPEEFLIEIGAIEPSDGEEQLQFTPAFESQIATHIETYRGGNVDIETIAGIFGVDSAHVHAIDRPYTAYQIINTVRKWPSAAALEFDAATDAAIREVTQNWDDVPPRQRYRLLQSLRSFQDDCFFCSGTIVFGDIPVKSCCSEHRVLTVHCESCDRRFLEFRAEKTEDTGPTVRTRGGNS